MRRIVQFSNICIEIPSLTLRSFVKIHYMLKTNAYVIMRSFQENILGLAKYSKDVRFDQKFVRNYR